MTEASSLGFGASGPWAMPWFSEAKAQRVLEAALGAGIRHLDTSPSYAGGAAEARLGRLLTRLEAEGSAARSALCISSKAGSFPAGDGKIAKDFSPARLRRQVEETLAYLGISALDILYLHGPDERQIDECLPLLCEMKDQGLIRAIGSCSDGRQLAHAAGTGGIDWLMAPYNVLRQHNGVALRAGQRQGKKIAIVAPLAQGLWRRDILLPRTPSGAWYAARAFLKNRDELRMARQARWLREEPGWTPAALALAFVRESLSPDLILTTTTKARHIRASAEAAARPLPDALRAKLQGLMVS